MKIFQVLKKHKLLNKKARLQKKVKSLQHTMNATHPYDPEYDKISLEYEWYRMELNMMP